MNKLIINDTIKNNIIIFFEEFHHKTSFSFIPIIDKELIYAFNNVNNHKPLSICLDIEFQSAIITDCKYIQEKNIRNENISKFIREIGMLFFLKDQEMNLYYIGHIFLNFKSLVHLGFRTENIKLIGVKYATVTQNTYDEMNTIEKVFHVETIIDPLYDEVLFENKKKYQLKLKQIFAELSKNYLFLKLLQKNNQDNVINILKNLKHIDNFDDILNRLKYIKRQLNNIQHEVYNKYLNIADKSYFNKLDKLYWNDRLVKERLHIINNKYEIFFNLFKSFTLDSVLVLKGKMDIIALKNTCVLITNKNNLKIDYYYDIETFNGFSNTHYKSSQLENTYKNLVKTNIYQNIAKELFDKIIINIGEKAHNPVVDSLFTIIVAIIINIGLNRFFKEDSNEIDINGGYYKKYLKYKYKYNNLKNN